MRKDGVVSCGTKHLGPRIGATEVMIGPQGFEEAESMKTSPVFAVKTYDGEFYWFDISWGEKSYDGYGWLHAVRWGREYSHEWMNGTIRDNREQVDPDDCEVELLGWTREDDCEKPGISISVQTPDRSAA